MINKIYQLTIKFYIIKIVQNLVFPLLGYLFV